MSVLDNLTDEQRTIVVSLPYRAGLWISKSDTTGGEEADEKELTALSNIIQGFSSQVFGSELLQHIMDETIKRKAEWPQWAQMMDAVPEDCKRSIGILAGQVDEKEINAYCNRIMEIAEAVALAFRENEQMSQMDEMMLYISYMVLKIRASLKKQPAKSYEQFLSISAKERQALVRLSEALNASYIV